MTRSGLWLIALVALLGVAVVATQHLALAQSTASPALRGFNDCDELHDHYVRLAVASAKEEHEILEEAEEEEAAVEEDAMADDSGVGGDAELPNTGTGPVDEGEVSETGTNIQERGVDEPDIILQQVEPQLPQGVKIQVLEIVRGWLQDHLVLEIMLQAVRVVAVAGVAQRGRIAGRVPEEGGALDRGE